jgi:hypothetical protein
MKLTSKINRRRSHSISVHAPEQNIDWEVIAKDVTSVHEVQDMMIRNLKGDKDALFKRLVSTVRTLYESPDEYERFHKMVVDEFGESDSVTPGTVRAYFTGCLSKSTVLPKGCNPVCAGSMPLPRELEGENSNCEFPIFITSNVNGKTVITKMNDVEDMSKAIVYVDANTPEEFAGFTKSEIDSFVSQGVESMRLISKDGTQAFGEWEEARSVKVCEGRELTAGGYSIWVILAGIAILLLILFIIYLIYKRQK